MTPTPAEWLRAYLADGDWHQMTDLTIAARTCGFAWGDVNAALDGLVDDLDWHLRRPVRVRLLPRRAQLELGGEG